MDKTLTTPRPGSLAMVGLANWYQFAPNEEVHHPRVRSRMLLWCHAGNGRVRVNREWLTLAPNEWVLLPWEHDILYKAAYRQPFFVGGIHLIPEADPRDPLTFSISHRPGDPAASLKGRHDLPAILPSTLHRNSFDTTPRLRNLAHYIVETFQREPPAEHKMRSLGQLLLEELQSTDQPHAAIPPQLRGMQEYAQAHWKEQISIEELAQIAGCSPATVHRLFIKHNGVSPGRWMTLQRLARAQTLLQTTSLPVKEVATRIGIPDPYHFSRLFKQSFGLSPKAYQKQNRLL